MMNRVKVAISPIQVPPHKRGVDILRDPSLNKGLSFSNKERHMLKLECLLPSAVETLEQQVDRLWLEVTSIERPLDKYIFLENIKSSSLLLYYALLSTHFCELAPVVYTPTVGEACIQFSKLPLSRNWLGTGLYISSYHRGKIAEYLNCWPQDDVEVIVLTDGGRILGLGDLGINGMPIPMGKLSLYVSLGGINPNKTLPIVLDIGSNSNSILESPNYIGLHESRLKDEEYFLIMDELVSAIFSKWPKVVLQWEDVTTTRAIDLLEKYRNIYRCFNDDIQGTASITLAGILSALNITKGKLEDQRILLCGAGSASIGIVNLIIKLMISNGITKEDALARFWVVDSKGLITRHRDVSTLDKYKIPFMRTDIEKEIKSLVEIVNFVRPTILLGASGQAGVFNEEVVRCMSLYVECPIIFALSNPTSKAECIASDAYNWTDGRVIYASGSPMEHVTRQDGSIWRPTQCNNMFAFPGIGLGAYIGQLSHIPDECFIAVATAIATAASNSRNDEALFPPLTAQFGLDLSTTIAADIITTARRLGIIASDSEQRLPVNYDELVDHIKMLLWVPHDVPYVDTEYKHLCADQNTQCAIGA
ncbi:putative NADP-dependent malic enzyme [Cryptosporidium serpentis]